MFNLFDILQNQAGPGMQTIGQQFGLTPDQSLSAMNALLPAIAAGLQRSAASDPMGFGRLLGMAGMDHFPGAAPQPPTQADFLGQLFGSPMVNQAVLQQASAVSGIGQQALRQMLPVMAGMVVAGIVHMMINQPPPAPVQQPAPKPPPPEPGFPGATMWNDWISQFAGPYDPSLAGSEKAAVPTARPPAIQEPEKPAQPAASKNEQGEAAPLDTFQQMFETGVQVQEQNAKAMQDIFDAFWKPAEPAAPTAPVETVELGLRESADGSEKAVGTGKPATRRKGK